MKSISVSELRSKCYEVLENVPREGLAITKRGKTVARIFPERKDVLGLLGSVPGIVLMNDLLSTGE